MSNLGSNLPRVGIYINNGTTSFLCSRFIDSHVKDYFEPVFLFTSETHKKEVKGERFDAFESRMIGSYHPWRKKRRNYIRTYFYATSYYRLKRRNPFPELDGLIVFKDDGTLDRVLVILAKANGVKTICIQEEAIYDYRNRSGRNREISRIFSFLQGLVHKDLPVSPDAEKGQICDFNIVYGTKKKERLLERGYPEDQIFCLGNPIYDGMVLGEPCPGLDRSLIFVHQQTFDRLANEEEWYRAVVRAAEKVGVKVVFKLHPRSSRKREHFEALVQSENVEIVIQTEGDIQAEPLRYGLFITGDSLAVNRALADGVVPILMNGANPKERYLDLAQIGAALEALDPKALEDQIIAFFDNQDIRKRCLENRPRAIESHLGSLDGQAGKRYQTKIAGLLWNSNGLVDLSGDAQRK